MSQHVIAKLIQPHDDTASDYHEMVSLNVDYDTRRYDSIGRPLGNRGQARRPWQQWRCNNPDCRARMIVNTVTIAQIADQYIAASGDSNVDGYVTDEYGQTRTAKFEASLADGRNLYSAPADPETDSILPWHLIHEGDLSVLNDAIADVHATIQAILHKAATSHPTYASGEVCKILLHLLGRIPQPPAKEHQ